MKTLLLVVSFFLLEISIVQAQTELIAEEDRVACRLSHKAVNRGEWTSHLGKHAVTGKTVNWQAIAIFRLRDRKIAEEWVCRDELGMLIELGVCQSSRRI